MTHGPENFDIVARRLADGRYNIVQIVGKADRLVEGPLSGEAARGRALTVAHLTDADAWFEVAPGVFESL